MGKLPVGSIVFVNFPFSNLKEYKLRPAIVLANAEFDDVILCQITSKSYSSKTSIKIDSNSFTRGGLSTTSYVRPDKLFTIERSIIKKQVGQLNKATINIILKRVCTLFTPK